MSKFHYYLITDREKCASGSLVQHVEVACKAGIKAVQLREKDLSDRELLELADELREVTRRHNSYLFINDRVDIALMVEADGVHCRETSLSPDTLKQMAPSLMIGASVHSLERAKQQEKAGADFVMFGPVFYTPSKEEYGEPKGLVALQEITRFMRVPVFAVGGITPENAAKCIEYNADGIAGISSLMTAEDPSEVVDDYKNILGDL